VGVTTKEIPKRELRASPEKMSKKGCADQGYNKRNPKKGIESISALAGLLMW
jgi:hypothetical protein